MFYRSSAETNIMLAVVKQAVVDYTRAVGQYGPKFFKRRPVYSDVWVCGAEAILWINDNNKSARGYIFSFLNICEYCGIEHNRVREHLAQIDSEEAAAITRRCFDVGAT